MTDKKVETSIAIVVPHDKFVGGMQKTGGHISHFKGVVNGFLENGYSVITFLKDPFQKCINPKDDSKHIEIHGKSRIDYLLRLFFWLFKTKRKFSAIYMRHSLGAIAFYPLFFLIFRNKKKILELNSFSSMGSISFYFERKSLYFFDSIIVVSKQLEKKIPKYFLSKTIVITNGVDLNRFKVKSTNQELNQDSKIIFGFIGSIKKYYGIEKLLDMFSKLDMQNYILAIAGNGPLLKKLQQSYSRFQNIKFYGEIEFDNVPNFLSTCSILVYPGDNFINFQSPIKIYEYLAAGKPILGANVNSLDEIINTHHRKAGLIFDHNNFNDFKKKASILAESIRLRNELGSNALSIANQHSWKNKVKEIIDFAIL